MIGLFQVHTYEQLLRAYASREGHQADPRHNQNCFDFFQILTRFLNLFDSFLEYPDTVSCKIGLETAGIFEQQGFERSQGIVVLTQTLLVDSAQCHQGPGAKRTFRQIQ
jgi:hypothetical protein